MRRRSLSLDVLKEIFKEGFRRDFGGKGRVLKRINEEEETESRHLDEAEEEKVQKRLKGLGYL